jgi:hypothetical protein
MCGIIKKVNKAQSLIVQFILFFLIGFTLFLSVGVVFKYQKDIFRSDVSDYGLALTNSYLSSIAINSMYTCKLCNYVDYKIRLSNTTADYIMEIAFDHNGINTSISLVAKNYHTSAHNLNYSTNLAGKTSTFQPITLTYNRTKNELRVV